jgi:hypothetical protein
MDLQLLFLVVLVIISLAIFLFLAFGKVRIKFRPSDILTGQPALTNMKKFSNPGCNADDQSCCTARARAGKCEQSDSDTDKCTMPCKACNDYEGEGCVPQNCAQSACINGA